MAGMSYLFEVFTLLPLIVGFALLLRVKKRLSISLFYLSFPFIFLARMCEMLIKFGQQPFGSFLLTERALSTLSDASDVVGIVLLLIGIVHTVRDQTQAEAQIEQLETLLPLCASCKKFRTAEGAWKPIEEYLLLNSGARQITHSYCPSCADDLMKSLRDTPGCLRCLRCPLLGSR